MADPKIKIMNITPEMAADWLTRNTKNRRLRQNVVDAYARDIEKGQWPVNGETFKLDRDNNLLDGQHRLKAIVQTGKAMRSIVVTGLPPEVRDTIDSGITRTASDLATMLGIPYAIVQTSAARLALRLASGDADLGRKITNTEVIEFILDNPDLEAAARHASEVRKQVTGCRPSLLAYAYLVLARIDPKDAQSFWEAAANLFPAYIGDPAVSMARKFNELALKRRQRLTDLETLSLIYRAWNKRRQGAEVKAINVLWVRSPAELPEPK